MQNQLALQLKKLCKPSDPLLLTNVYDSATAKIVLAHPSTKAIATASFAMAEQAGLTDNEFTFSQNLAQIREIGKLAASAHVPLTVDLQDGYDDVKQTIRQVIEAGAVGCNLEDVELRSGRIRSVEHAADNISLAMEAAREAGVPDFVVNARTDILEQGGSIDEAIARGRAYLAAGATTVYVWGGLGGRGVSRDEVKELVAGLNGMVNVRMKLFPGYLTADEIAKLGVARISVGPDLYIKAMDAFRESMNAVIASQAF